MKTSRGEIALLLNSDAWQALQHAGHDVSKHLSPLSRSANRLVAARAVYLAGMINDQTCQSVVREAAKSRVAIVRVAAAHAARNLQPSEAISVLNDLLKSKDAGVRKFALESISSLGHIADLTIVQKVAQKDSHHELRKRAQKELDTRAVHSARPVQ